jgi:DNA-binding LytR/AlgR family response regulator
MRRLGKEVGNMEIAVCDDNKLFLEEIRAQLQTLPIVGNSFMFSDLDAFLFSIDGGKSYDAVLMDIEWHYKAAGMDAAGELYRLCPETQIIYVTGHVDRFSQQIFLHRANLSGYLTKPVNIELLRANLQKIADALPFREQPSLVLRRQGALVSVPLREIYFIESKRHIIHVHAAGEIIAAYDRLENILCSLPIGFYQCHKSFIVNMSHISNFLSNDIMLKNGGRVPVSRARYAETRKAYFKYMGQSF